MRTWTGKQTRGSRVCTLAKVVACHIDANAEKGAIEGDTLFVEIEAIAASIFEKEQIELVSVERRVGDARRACRT